MLGLNRTHVAALSPPLDRIVDADIFLPEFDRKPVEDPNSNSELGFPSNIYSGSMELMAVPKKKVLALSQKCQTFTFVLWGYESD